MSSSNQLADMQARLVAQSTKMKGYLDKKSGNVFVGYQSRYFLIVEQSLAYYKDESLTEPRGKIDIKAIKQVEKQGNRDFTVDTGQRKYNLRASSQVSRDDWVSCLNLLREFHQMGGQLSKESKSLYYTKWKQLIGSQRHRLLTPEPQSDTDRLYRAVFKQLSLSLLSQDYSTPAVKSRLLIQKFKEGFYFCVSCKSLYPEFDDELMLPKDYIEPYDFNVLYAYQRDGSEARTIFSTNKISSVYIVDGKYLKINLLLLTIQEDVSEFVERIKTSVAVGKEYHNDVGVCLRRNVDATLRTYDQAKDSFQKIEKLNTRFEIDYNDILSDFDSSYRKQYSSFSKMLERLLGELEDFVGACRVKSPPRLDVIKLYLEFMHDKVYKLLRGFWNDNHENLANLHLLRLAHWVNRYSIQLKGYVRDERLQTGVKILLDIYFRNANTELNEAIKNIFSNTHYYELSVAHCTKLPFEFVGLLEKRLKDIEENFQLKELADNVELLLRTTINTAAECVSELVQRDRNLQFLSALCNDVWVYRKNLSMVKHTSLALVDKTVQKMHGTILKRMATLLLDPISSSEPVEFCTEAFRLTKSLKNVQNSSVVELQHCTVRIVAGIYLTSILMKKPPAEKTLEQLAIDIPQFEKVVNEHGPQFQGLVMAVKCIERIVQSDPNCKILDECLQLKELIDELSASDLQQLLRLSMRAGSIDSEKLIECIYEGKERGVSEAQSKSSDIFKSYHPRSLEHDQQSQQQRLSTLTMSLSGHTKYQLEGYLEMKDEKGYKQRFFRYSERCLKWYHSATSRELVNRIQLNEIAKIHIKNKHDKFEIERKDGTMFKFKATSEASAARWADELNKLMSTVQPQIPAKEDLHNKHSQELFRDYFTASEVSISEDEPADQRLLSIMSMVSTQRNRDGSPQQPNFQKKTEKPIEQPKPKPEEKKRSWFRLGCLGLE